MADNITLNAGSGGATLATDDDGTAQHQYVKVEWGADNTQTPVSTGASALPIQDGGNSITVDNAGLTELAAAINSSRVDVNIAASAATQTVSGTVTANLGATDNAVLDTIAANTANLTNCIVQDDSPFTPAAGYLMMIGGEFDDAGTDSVDEGDAGNVRITANRSMHTTIRDAAGNERGLNIDANGDIGVTNADLTTLAGAVAGSEVQVDVVGSLPAGTNAIGKLAANSGVDIGDVDVTSISAGSNLIGDVGLSGARTSGGTTIFRSIDLDESEEEIKATAGQVYWIHAMNLSSSVLYLKLYNATAATVVVGTTTPVMTLPIATQGDTNGAGFTLSIPNGIAFGTAITAAATTGLADNDSGAPGANALVVNIGYA